jgi:D-alanyl-D-alanine carboxypeptidase (penicillin-binding protein 5/6)
LRNWGIIGLVFLLFATGLLNGATKVGAAEPSVDISAEAAILVDYDSGKILFEKNADAKKSPASMTKMMSEYLILEAIKKDKIGWDTKVKISDYVFEVSQDYELSNVPLRTDVTYTVEELYKAVAIYSANAATIALAELVAGSEANFVKMMNEQAKKFGIKTVKFVNSTGLNNKSLDGQHPAGGPNEENMMSARATAKLAYQLLKEHPEVLEIASIPKAEFSKGIDKPIEMDNWNLMLPGLLFEYKGIDGLKTGSTSKAGFCFTGTVKRNGQRLISVVMNTDSKYERFRQTEKLLDYGFNRFKKVTLLEKGAQFKNKKQLPVIKGKEDGAAIATKADLSMVVKQGTKDKYKPKLKLDESKLTKAGELTAPVKKGDKVGTVTVSGENEYGYLTEKASAGTTVDVVATENVEKANWFALTLRGIGGFFAGIWNSAADTIKGWL